VVSGWRRAPLDETARILEAWAAAPPTLLLFRTLKRVNAMRAELLELVSRGDRAAGLAR